MPFYYKGHSVQYSTLRRNSAAKELPEHLLSFYLALWRNITNYRLLCSVSSVSYIFNNFFTVYSHFLDSAKYFINRKIHFA